MVKRMYEGMFLLDSNRYARDPNVVSSQISQMVEKLGGDVLVSRLWSEQRLAYPIRGQRKGTYWLAYFRIDGPQIPKLERESHLNNNVLRSLIISVDERLADALVTHATGGTTAATSKPPHETKDDATVKTEAAADSNEEKKADSPETAPGSPEEKADGPTDSATADQ